MTASPTFIAAPPHRSRLLRELQAAPLSAKIGMAVVLAYLATALLAPWIAPYGQFAVVSDRPYAPASAEFWLGTDQLGRDLFSRLIYGARNSIGIALVTTLISFAIGSVVGILAASVGGIVDQLLSRLVDALMSIPELIFTLLLLTIFGSSILNLILIIAVIDATRIFRLSRAAALNIATLDFVESAKLRGEGLSWRITQEILPNILPMLISEFGMRFCFVFLSIAALSFLGVGLQPPLAEWGSMVRESAMLINMGKITPLIPAGAIALLTIGVNLVADWAIGKTSGAQDV